VVSSSAHNLLCLDNHKHVCESRNAACYVCRSLVVHIHPHIPQHKVSHIPYVLPTTCARQQRLGIATRHGPVARWSSRLGCGSERRDEPTPIGDVNGAISSWALERGDEFESRHIRSGPLRCATRPCCCCSRASSPPCAQPFAGAALETWRHSSGRANTRPCSCRAPRQIASCRHNAC